MKTSKPVTLVVGASENPNRYAHKAVRMLRSYGHEVYAFGLRPGKIEDVTIQTTWPEAETIHTVTLYIGPQRQADFYDRILTLNPKRIIFNPGTESPELINKVQNAGISAVLDCTLVMLQTGTF